MRLRQLFEELNRTGESKSAVVGWGRGMGHKGHMYLADAVITQANETGADPYFVVSRTIGKDDPITPEEKLHIYKKVFPKHGHIFHTATDEMPDLTRVLSQLNKHGYTDVTVVVGADQKNALNYVTQYNGTPDKAGNIPFDFNSLNVISRQETNSKHREEEGPRATPMRAALQDPNKSEEEKFQAWRDSMSPEVSDDEVRDLMGKAAQRMSDPTWGKKPKKEKAVAEIAGAFPSPSTRAQWAKDAAASNAAEARRQAELQRQANAARAAKLDANTAIVNRQNKINYHGANAPKPANASWDGDSDFLDLDGTQYAKASRMPIPGGEAPDMKLIATKEGWQVYIWTRNSLKGVVGRYFYPADKPNTIQKEDTSKAIDTMAKRLTDPNDGKVVKLRAAGDKRREEHLKSRDIAKKNEGMMDLLSKSKKDIKKKMASAEEMRKYFEKEKAKEPPKHKEPGDDKNIQAVHTRHAYENSIKYANKLLREMKANEFIREGKTTELHPDHDSVGKGVSRSRDVGGYDRVYHMNRLMMAMAMADGINTGKIKHASIDTWFEKYNTMHPMTKEEDNMIRAAMNTVPTDGKHISAFGKSVEPAGAYTKSPVAKPKKNKYGI